MADIAAAFAATPTADAHGPDFNVTPRRRIYVVREQLIDGAMQRELARCRWGLIPSWAKTPGIGDRLTNARAETAAEKPAFRNAFVRRRCIIPADGFYEWQPVPGSSKQPMYFTRADGAQLAFAGLYERWRDPQESAAPEIETCTIITTSANATVAPIHDRMPAILEAEAWDAWLDPAMQDRNLLDALVTPTADDVLAVHPVSRAVNSPANNGPDLIVRITPESLF